MPELLFIYGTLHPDRAPASIASAVRRLELVGEATIRGRLLDLGEYPGVILAVDPFATDDVPGLVQGSLFALPEGGEGASILAQLDAYEDFHPGDAERSLFLRQLTTATLNCAGSTNGAVRVCWVYTYNWRIV